MRRLLVLLLSFALGCAVSACSSEPAEVVCEAPEATSTVEMIDFDYVPRCVEASPGDTLTVENKGETPHTFSVGVVDIQVDVGAGETAELTLEGVEAGTTYDVSCVYHPQMTAAVKVV